MIKALKHLLMLCLKQDEVNSRFVYLTHGLVASLSLLILTIAFVCAKDKTGYDFMALAVGGSNAGAAVGRYYTKKAKAGGDTEEEQVETK